MRTWQWMLTAFLLLALSAMAQDTADQSSSVNTPAQRRPLHRAHTDEPQGDGRSPGAASEPHRQGRPQPWPRWWTVPSSGACADRDAGEPHAAGRDLSAEHEERPATRPRAQQRPLLTSAAWIMGETGPPGLSVQGGSFQGHLLGGVTKLFKYDYNPAGFSWMVFVDREDFDRAHYDFNYVHREFLGDVRCIVFDVTPKKSSGKGRFQGRIWVEDQDYNIVRMNGTYVPRHDERLFLPHG